MSCGGAHTSGEPRARCLGRGQERGRVIIRFLPARLAGEQVCIAVAALDNVRFEHSSFHRRVHGDRFVMEVRHAARRHHQKTQGSPTAQSSGSSAWVLRYLGEERQAHLGREVAAPKSGQLWRRKSRPIPGGGVWAHFGGGRQYIFAKCATDDTEANNPSFKARRGAAPILSESALIRDLELRSASRCCSPLCGSRGFHKPLRRSRPLRFSPQSKLARVSPIPKGGCMSPRCQ